jgi:outer membrane protein assembly factor BamB
MRMTRFLATLILATLGTVAHAQSTGANWAQWRGPNFNGSTSATNLPAIIDKNKPLWVTPLPGQSNATPAVWGDRILVTASHNETTKLLAICLNRLDGKVLWQKEVGEGIVRNNRNNYATPSPVTDGQKVIFLFGNGDLAAFSIDGNELWHRNLQQDHGKWNMNWVYGSSALLWGDKLYVPVIHRNLPISNWGEPKPGDSLADSFLLAVNPNTGKDLWKVVRPTEARAESQESYATPIPWVRNDRTEILLTGGDCISAHDPETGKELWRGGGWNPRREPAWRLVPSAVTWDGLAYVCPPKGGQILAFKAGGEGDVTKSHLAWKANGLTSDVCVPLVYMDHLYVLDGDKRQLFCVDPKTGERKWAGSFETRGVMRGSPTGADGKIYCTSEAGDVFVASADPAGGFKQLSKASLGTEYGPTRASVAAVDQMIFVRTGDKLWAFGGK